MPCLNRADALHTQRTSLVETIAINPRDLPKTDLAPAFVQWI